MKKTFLFSLILSFFPFNRAFLLASEVQRKLEVDYPQLGEVRPVYATGDGLPEYISYMIQFFIALSLLITVLSLIRGGLSWVMAKGDPGKIKEGKERLTGSVFGIIIILSSFLFLSSINPALVELESLEVVKVEESFPPGIYLSPYDYIPENIEEMSGDVYRTSHPIRNLEDREVKSIRIANQLDGEGEILGYYYAVVVHGLSAFRGRCEIFINDSSSPKDFSVPENISSVSVIRVNNEPLEIGGVTAHLRPDFNERYPSENLTVYTDGFSPLSINEVWSIDIDGLYGVILASGNSWETTRDGCGVFLDSKPLSDLKEHHMNKCNPRKEMPFFAAYDSCASHYMVLPLFR